LFRGSEVFRFPRLNSFGVPVLGLDVELVRGDFPELRRIINGFLLAYLDNAATTLKPLQVIDAISDFYRNRNANVGRGVHQLALEATEAYENARRTVAGFIGANPKEVIFTKNATDSLNMVAEAWASIILEKGDIIVSTLVEHHSNLLPWARLARRKGLELRLVPVKDDGTIDYDALEELADGARLIAVTHKSNVTGAVTDVERVVGIARKVGAMVVLDAAQSVPHMSIDVKSLGVDFLAFSGHKMLGPTGIGVLYAKKERLEEMQPYQVGGGIVTEVHCESGSCSAGWIGSPNRFEAGTPNIAGAVGLEAAVNYLEKIGMDAIVEHEVELTEHLLEELTSQEKVSIVGPLDAKLRYGVVSFAVEGFGPHEVASILDSRGIAVRSGLHCAQPLHEALGLRMGTVRASLYLYNTMEEVDRLVSVLKSL